VLSPQSLKNGRTLSNRVAQHFLFVRERRYADLTSGDHSQLRAIYPGRYYRRLGESNSPAFTRLTSSNMVTLVPRAHLARQA